MQACVVVAAAVAGVVRLWTILAHCFVYFLYCVVVVRPLGYYYARPSPCILYIL